MKRDTLFTLLITLLISGSCTVDQKPSGNEPIKAYDIDFNWGEGGPNGFAAPGLWADADPIAHVEWYDALGCNVIQSFAVSCNGYAWYKNGIVPEQPGLVHDFLTEQVKLAHQKNIRVFGYFCAGSNTRWGLENPDYSYGVPSAPHIPYTTKYIDFLCASIEDAIKKTGIDGVFIDWLWNPGAVMEPYPPLKWIACEQEMFGELMGQPFPGIEKITPETELEFRRKAIDRTWKRIKETIKKANPDCIIWLTCAQLTNRDIAGSDMLREVDWVLNEAGDTATTASAQAMLGEHTRMVTCLANWNGQDAAVVIPDAIRKSIGLYGFTKPSEGSIMPPVDYYLSVLPDNLNGDARNIALLARTYNGLPVDYVKK
ncbi:MAG TPA: hypothetical protein VMV47_16155 [Bacteroidales bacterium]|nr:hypothetical protein [Bacteroidales bacterium]